MRRPLLTLVLCVVACEAPPIGLAPTDAAIDTLDARVCAKVIGPDGMTCTGPDEDGDCIPDSCDDCPNVPQRVPSGRAAGIAVVGSDCQHPSTPFDQIGKRLRFEPCSSTGPWSSSALVEGDRWSVAGGVAGLGQGGGDPTWTLLSSSSRLVDVSVLARMRVIDGDTAGILFRADATFNLKAYFCVIDSGRLMLAQPMACALGGCTALLPLADGDGTPSVRPIVANTSSWFYLRGAIVGRTLECQAYPAPDNPGDGKLRDLPPNAYTVRAVVPDTATLLESGAVGFFANRTRVEISSVDVLTR